jgi:hypothetical protein
MQTIKMYLTGIVPYLEAELQKLSEMEQTEEQMTQVTFVSNLLKEIAELTANQGEENGKEGI